MTTDPFALAAYATALRPVVAELRTLAEDATAEPSKRVHARSAKARRPVIEPDHRVDENRLGQADIRPAVQRCYGANQRGQRDLGKTVQRPGATARQAFFQAPSREVGLIQADAKRLIGRSEHDIVGIFQGGSVRGDELEPPVFGCNQAALARAQADDLRHDAGIGVLAREHPLAVAAAHRDACSRVEHEAGKA